MTNPIFRNRVLGAVQAAIRDYRDAAAIDHAGLRGRVREIAVEHLLRPLLPGAFDLGTGKIVDASGGQSAETDVVIYSRFVLPPILYSQRDGIFPAEACFYALEIKSILTAAELDDAIHKATRLRTLTYQSGQYDERSQQVVHTITPIIFVVFAFASDLTGKTELERYQERDSQWATQPCVRALCVIGKGYWWFGGSQQRWHFHPPTPAGDEAVDLVSGIVNTIPDSLVLRGRPRLGHYLMEQREMHLIESPVQRPVA